MGEKRDGERMPNPGKEDVDAFADQILAEVGERQRAKGLERYGQPLRTWDGRDAWMDDALPEYYDLGRYLAKAKMQYDDVVDLLRRVREFMQMHVVSHYDDYDLIWRCNCCAAPLNEDGSHPKGYPDCEYVQLLAATDEEISKDR